MMHIIDDFHSANQSRFDRLGIKRVCRLVGPMVEPYFSYSVYQRSDWYFLVRDARRDSVTVRVTNSIASFAALNEHEDPDVTIKEKALEWTSIFAFTYPKLHAMHEMPIEEKMKIFDEAMELQRTVPWDSISGLNLYLGGEMEKLCQMIENVELNLGT